MPLDGVELFDNPALAKLGQVERLLAREDQWCKGRLHDRHGRHCLAGAIIAADARQELTRPVIRAVREVSGRHYWRIASFNDDPGTSHRDVLRVLRRARVIIVDDIARANDGTSRSWKFAETVKAFFAVVSAGMGLGVDPIDDAAPAPAPVRIERPTGWVRSAGVLSPTRETSDFLQ
jgi:hypothetical protein